MICLADKNDAVQIAEIHKAEIKKGFLSSLKVMFLKNLYLAIIESKYSFCIVTKENGNVVGFIAGVTDLNKFYIYFLRKYFFQSVFLLFKKIFSISYIKKIFETLFYPLKKGDLPKPELLTMAVISRFHEQGIAGKMFLEFTLEMKKRNVKSFKVLVSEELLPAINFYEKNGFSFLKQVSVHDNKISRIYIYNL